MQLEEIFVRPSTDLGYRVGDSARGPSFGSREASQRVEEDVVCGFSEDIN